MKAAAAVLLLLPLLASPAAASTWTVDDSGGADFTTIQAAIDSAKPGDVLLVHLGNYAAFTLDRDLSILAVPGAAPFVIGESHILTDNVAVAGLHFNSLDVVGAAGFVLLDGIQVDGNLSGPLGCTAGLVVSGCAQVHIERSTIHGKNGDYYCESRGLRVVDSVVTLTDCTVTGGTGWGDDFYGYAGQEGLDVEGQSAVLLSETSVFGGNGGTPQILFGGQGGWGEVALKLNWSDESGPATVTVRGSSASILKGGHAGQGIGGLDAWAAASGYGTLKLSGVGYDPPSFGALLDVELPVPAEPFVTLVGGDAANAFKRLNLHGPNGAALWLFASLHPAQLSLPGPIDGTIWLDLGTPVLILPFTLLGQQLPVNLTFKLPPVLTGLEGIVVTFQGFAAGLGGDGNFLATNPVHLLLR